MRTDVPIVGVAVLSRRDIEIVLLVAGVGHGFPQVHFTPAARRTVP